MLPGARELRTPLVTGVCLALAVWVLFGDGFPTSAEATGFVARGYDAAGAVGATTVLVLASFACYLVGSVYVSALLPAVKVLLTRPRLAGQYRYPFELVVFVDDELRYAAGRELSGEEKDLVRLVADETFRTATTLRPRLLVASRDLYDEMDRDETEADLRLGLAMPLALLAVGVAAEWTPWAMVGLLVSVLLAYQGTEKLRASRRVFIEAIVQGIVQSPPIETQKRQLAEQRERTSAVDPARRARQEAASQRAAAAGPEIYMGLRDIQEMLAAHRGASKSDVLGSALERVSTVEASVVMLPQPERGQLESCLDLVRHHVNLSRDDPFDHTSVQVTESLRIALEVAERYMRGEDPSDLAEPARSVERRPAL